jgi:hypothetical protein
MGIIRFVYTLWVLFVVDPVVRKKSAVRRTLRWPG